MAERTAGPVGRGRSVLRAIHGIAMVSGIIVAHELAHLVTAVALGVPVETFSLGVGPSLIGFDALDIHWQVSWLLLGGYVWLATDVTIPAWRSIVIALAGPVSSIALGLWLIRRTDWAPAAARDTTVWDRVPVVDVVRLVLRVGPGRTALGIGIFNLLPIPLLDGSKIIVPFLSETGLVIFVGVGVLMLGGIILMPLLTYGVRRAWVAWQAARPLRRRRVTNHSQTAFHPEARSGMVHGHGRGLPVQATGGMQVHQ